MSTMSFGRGSSGLRDKSELGSRGWRVGQFGGGTGRTSDLVLAVFCAAVLDRLPLGAIVGDNDRIESRESYLFATSNVILRKRRSNTSDQNSMRARASKIRRNRLATSCRTAGGLACPRLVAALSTNIRPCSDGAIQYVTGRFEQSEAYTMYFTSSTSRRCNLIRPCHL